VEIVLGGDCPRWQLSGWQLSWVAIVLGDSCPRWQLSHVAVVLVGDILGGSCPGGYCPRTVKLHDNVRS